jgi:hypothetical protein
MKRSKFTEEQIAFALRQAESGRRRDRQVYTLSMRFVDTGRHDLK